MIRLRFSTTRSLIPSGLIRLRTGCDQSHVELINDLGYTLGARWCLHREDNGVRLRPPSSTQGQIRVVHATFPNIEDAWYEGIRLVGTPYDLRGIFGILCARNWFHPNALDCSRFILKIAMLAGNPLLPERVIADWKQTPRDLFESEHITLLD